MMVVRKLVIALLAFSTFCSSGECHSLLQTTLSAMFVEPGGGECSLPTVSQQADCVTVPGLPSVLSRARQLAHDTCQASLRYELWNCPLPNRTSFQTVTRETAFLYALYSAALSYRVARSCAQGELVCGCGPSTGQSRPLHKLSRNICPDNIQYGLRLTRSLLRLNQWKHQHDAIGRHNVFVGLKVLRRSTEEKCVCPNILRECQPKICYKQLRPFIAIVDVLREFYQKAVLVEPSNDVRTNYTRLDSLLFTAVTPPQCDTHGQPCRPRAHCAALCCGRGFTTHSRPYRWKCRCRWSPIRHLTLDCDLCHTNRLSYTCN